MLQRLSVYQSTTGGNIQFPHRLDKTLSHKAVLQSLVTEPNRPSKPNRGLGHHAAVSVVC